MDLLKRLHIQAVNPGAFSGYAWESDVGGERMPSINPTSNAAIAEIATCSIDDYQTVIIQAQQAFLTWREVPAPLRGDIIRQIGQALREYKEDLGGLVSLEMGKSKAEGLGEVQEMIDIADFAVGQSRMLYGKTMHSERPAHRLYEQWHPYGIVGVISAFNFPVAVWAWNAFIAAICGNVVVWKPSSKTPLCAIAVHEICKTILEKNQAPAIFSLIIPTSHDVATTMVNDSRIPLISFTGSTSVGKEVAVNVARRLGRTILELGGNNAIILDESADLSLAIPAIVFSVVGTAGQRCTSARRLFVQEGMLDDVISRLQHAYAQITIGNPNDHLMGPLIDTLAVEQFKQALQRIRAAGGQILFGGNVLKQLGNFVQPTLVSGLENSDAIVQEETFAPILYIIPYKTLKDAIAMQNAVPQGLSSSLFTQNLLHSEYYLSVLGSDCGIANVNIGTSGAEIGGAFGGEKETGGGRESGSDAWKAYMRRQTNTINWGSTLPLAQGIEWA